MAIRQAEIDFKCKVTDSPALGVDGVSDKEFVFELGTSAAFTLPTSTIPATQQWQDENTLSAGARTIDLSSLTFGNFSTAKNFTGLKVQLFKFIASSSNTDNIQIVDGGTNGYLIFDSASSHVQVPAGGIVMYYAPEGLADIDATHKTIDLTSADADASYQVQIVAG